MPVHCGKRANPDGIEMRIDLRKDSIVLAKAIADRVKDYPVYINKGPGDDEDPITLITLGYQFDQAGWVALVFDTRPNAGCDGEWQSYIEGNAVMFRGWFKAFDDMLSRRSTLSITLPNGKARLFTADSQIEDVAECFGLMCRSPLEEGKTGVFKKLPLARKCDLAVEEQGGFFGWTTAKQTDQEKRAIARLKLRHAAKRLSKSRATRYWLGQLERVARRAPSSEISDHVDVIRDVEQALDELAAICASTIVPLLGLANRWARASAYQVIADRAQERPIQTVLYMAFQKLAEIGCAGTEAELLIQQYIREAVKVRPVFAKRHRHGLYGVAPWHAARLLHANYQGYPEPRKTNAGNRLINAERFAGNKRITTKGKA